MEAFPRLTRESWTFWGLPAAKSGKYSTGLVSKVQGRGRARAAAAFCTYACCDCNCNCTLHLHCSVRSHMQVTVICKH